MTASIPKYTISFQTVRLVTEQRFAYMAAFRTEGSPNPGKIVLSTEASYRQLAFLADLLTAERDSLFKERVTPHEQDEIAQLVRVLATGVLQLDEAIAKIVKVGVFQCQVKMGLKRQTDQVFNQKLLALTFNGYGEDARLLMNLQGNLSDVVTTYAEKALKGEPAIEVANRKFLSLVAVKVAQLKRRKEEAVVAVAPAPVAAVHAAAPALTRKDLERFSPEQIAALTDADLINSRKFPAAQLPHISPAMVPKLSNERLQLLGPCQIREHLLGHQVPFLNSPALDHLTVKQVEDFLPPRKVRQLTNPVLIAGLEDKAADVHPNMVKFLVRPEQFAKLTEAGQIHAVPNEHVIHVTPIYSKYFSDEQWGVVLASGAKESFLPYLPSAEMAKFLPDKLQSPISTPPQGSVKPEKNIWTATWANLADYSFLQKLYFACIVLPYRWLFKQ